MKNIIMIGFFAPLFLFATIDGKLVYGENNLETKIEKIKKHQENSLGSDKKKKDLKKEIKHNKLTSHVNQTKNKMELAMSSKNKVEKTKKTTKKNIKKILRKKAYKNH